jgi:L-threonylcarbamoyladenylate synthase
MARAVDVEEAISILRGGGIVGFPTETVYGLGADAENDAAVARIFVAKGRPRAHPLIVHLAAIDALDGWIAAMPPAAQRLADLLWPGPLTLILERGPRAHDALTGGLSTVGVRVPAHPIARALIEGVGGGIAAPSANRFGSVSPTTAEHVARDLGDRIDGIVDGGPCEVGLESTIVDVSQGIATLLRPGAVAAEEIERILGAPLARPGADAPRAPGMLASHYAPRARLVATRAEDASRCARELTAPGARLALLAPRDVIADVEGATRIDVPSDARDRARTLYASLRAIDERGFTHAIVILPDDERGLGAAIADRLRRAAGAG